MMRSGWRLLRYIEEGMTLTKRRHSIRLERKVHTTKGLIFVARFVRKEINKNTNPTNIRDAQ